MSVFGGEGQTQGQFQQSLNKVFIFYGVGFAAFVIVLGVLEQMGMSKDYIGYAFLAATVLLYAGIGVMTCDLGHRAFLFIDPQTLGEALKDGKRARAFPCKFAVRGAKVGLCFNESLGVICLNS